MLKTFEISPKMLRKIERKKMKNGDKCRTYTYCRRAVQEDKD